MKAFQSLVLLLLPLIPNAASSAPDHADRLFAPVQEHTAPIMTSHVSGDYRFDLLSPMIMTEYGDKTEYMPHLGEAYHGVFMVVTDRDDNVVFFRSDMTQKEFLFKENFTPSESKAYESYLTSQGIDADQVDLMVTLNTGGNSSDMCEKARTLFFKTQNGFSLMHEACGDSLSTWTDQ